MRREIRHEKNPSSSTRIAQDAQLKKQSPSSQLIAHSSLLKKQAAQGGGIERPGWRSPPGRRVKSFYIEDGLLPVVGVDAGALPPVVLVIRRTSTRRLSARPAEVLFGSTGLSLPSPITQILCAGTLYLLARYWITELARRWLRS